MAAKRKIALEQALVWAADPATDAAVLAELSRSREEAVAVAALANPNLPFGLCIDALSQAYTIDTSRNYPLYFMDVRRFPFAVAAAKNPQWPFEVLTSDVFSVDHSFNIDQIVARVFLAYVHELVLTILDEGIVLPRSLSVAMAQRLRVLWQAEPEQVEDNLFVLSSHDASYKEQEQEAYTAHRSFVAIAINNNKSRLSPSERVRWCVDSYLALRAGAMSKQEVWISDRLKRDGRRLNVAENRFLHAACGWLGEEAPPLNDSHPLV